MSSSYLANWITDLLGQPNSVLARKYKKEYYGEAYEEVQQLHESNGLRYPVRHPADVPDELLDQLATKIRGTTTEGAIWAAIIVHLGRPLPPPIAYDLLERRIAFDILGHSRQVDEIQWKLAEVHDEALLTLAIDLYTLPQYSLAAMQTVLTKFRDNWAYRWMLDTLAHLYEASSPEKEQAYLAAATAHPDAERLLSAHHLKQQQLQARSATLTPELAEALFLTGIPSVLERLASNPQTPEAVLRKLMEPQATRRERRIGAFARQTLAATRKYQGAVPQLKVEE